MLYWPDDTKVLALCVPLVKQFEGFRSAPYRDSADIPTIGYGTTMYASGRKVSMADRPISEAEASEFLEKELLMKRRLISGLFQRMPTLHQAAAMLSLAYNIGTGAFQTSTVLKRFNEGDMLAAANAFLLWNKETVGGKKVKSPGLLNRRQIERSYFLTPDRG